MTLTADPTIGIARNPAVDSTLAQAQRVVTGDRPTGPLHLGHYIGTLANRVRLSSACPPWTYGASHLLRDLAAEELL